MRRRRIRRKKRELIEENTDWLAQNLALFQQLETDYDHALQEINLDLQAKLSWIRCSATYSIVLVLAYLLLGAVFFSHVANWTLLESMLFAVYTMTATGYGNHLTPKSSSFQWFLIFYILIGIAALAIMVCPT
jgi:hypothetical protein